MIAIDNETFTLQKKEISVGYVRKIFLVDSFYACYLAL